MLLAPTRREKPVKPLRVGRFLPDPSRKSRKIYTGLLGKRMAGRRLEGIRRPKADKGVLEGLSPRIMSQKANGGGRPQCDDKERQPLGAGRVCGSHHRGQNVLRIPLVPERIPAVENEKTLTRVSDKQEFIF